MDVIRFVQEYCPAWKALAARVEDVAPTSWPLLLTGPRGSGKTLLARFIHERSGRKEFVARPAPFIAEGLLQGELLGHARGAYTDAREDQKGLFELAHQGTLFFDEIEAASYALQSFLVGQVETSEIRRLGAARTQQVDVRFVYASNSSLPQLVEQGRFRADLLDRIGGLTITVPALSEYTGAISGLVRHFLEDHLRELGRLSCPELSVDVELALLHHRWPGNLRELRNVSREIALAVRDQGVVVLEHLPEYLRARKAPGPDQQAHRALRERIERVLAETQGNKSEAARRLGIPRNRFSRLVRRMSRMAPDLGAA